ncbi:MAG TPA: hypothetical protein VMS40_08140, partial [Vicinamibacterales bacterium]|nr:hypothetical protein [Vicinamibacterales bacterium]
RARSRVRIVSRRLLHDGPFGNRKCTTVIARTPRLAVFGATGAQLATVFPNLGNFPNGLLSFV